VLQRLFRKGLVKREEQGRSHVYSPAISREEFAALRGQSLAGALTGLGAAGVSAFLAEATRLDPELVAQLRREMEREP
jgi:predicted transcriptional regulator